MLIFFLTLSNVTISFSRLFLFVFRPPLDVAFLGESVVEAMDGRWLGKHIIGTERRTKDFNRIDKVSTHVSLTY